MDVLLQLWVYTLIIGPLILAAVALGWAIHVSSCTFYSRRRGFFLLLGGISAAVVVLSYVLLYSGLTAASFAIIGLSALALLTAYIRHMWRLCREGWAVPVNLWLLLGLDSLVLLCCLVLLVSSLLP